MSDLPEEIDEKIDDELSTIDKTKLVELWQLYKEYYTDLLNYVPDKKHPNNSFEEHAERKFNTYIHELSNSYMSKEWIEADIDKETKTFRVIKMMVAIRETKMDEVRQLFALDNSILFEKDREKDTPILKACRNCNAERILHFLLENGANIEDRDSINQTPLIIASQHGCDQLVKILLKAGANVHHTAEYSKNALITATEENYPKIVRMLLEAGADPNVLNEDNETPMEIALRIHRGKPTELSKTFGKGKRSKTKKQRKNRKPKQSKTPKTKREWSKQSGAKPVRSPKRGS